MRIKILISLLLIQKLSFSQTLPDFKLISLDGDTLTTELLKGKQVYINVFESWCGACLTETPIINFTKENLKDVLFIAITPANFKKAAKFKEKGKFNLEIYPEASELCKYLKVKSYPTHFFVDKNGKVDELQLQISVSWRRKDYENGKPAKKEFKEMLFEQNKMKIENEINKRISK